MMVDYQKQSVHSQDILNTAENKGVEKVAINMLKQNLDNKLISSVTGLTLEEILKLKNKN